MAVRAAASDPRVDGDVGAGRDLLDRLEHRHADAALGGNRGVERQVPRHGGQERGHQRRVLGAGEAQRGVE